MNLSEESVSCIIVRSLNLKSGGEVGDVEMKI